VLNKSIKAVLTLLIGSFHVKAQEKFLSITKKYILADVVLTNKISLMTKRLSLWSCKGQEITVPGEEKSY
jgi:hypothetical protein